MKRTLIAFVASVAAAPLGTGCMDTQTASLGASAHRESDAGAYVERTTDTATSQGPDTTADVDAATHDNEGRLDAGVLASAVDASTRNSDAGHHASTLDADLAPPAIADAGPTDASVAHPDEHDGSHEDAKVPVNPLCIAEPWHCT